MQLLRASAPQEGSWTKAVVREHGGDQIEYDRGWPRSGEPFGDSCARAYAAATVSSAKIRAPGNRCRGAHIVAVVAVQPIMLALKPKAGTGRKSSNRTTERGVTAPRKIKLPVLHDTQDPNSQLYERN